MNILSIAMIAFICMELMNVGMLYFMPGSKMGNGIGVFNAWEKSKADSEVHELIKYLVYWVAGTKLIFIGLIIVIIITGDWITQVLATAILILSIFSFYWRLYPIMRKADARGEISPKGYSKTLAIMIASFIGVFSVALIIALLTQ